MLYVKADDESILPYGEEVQRRQAVFMPLDLSTVVLGIGITTEYLLRPPESLPVPFSEVWKCRPPA